MPRNIVTSILCVMIAVGMLIGGFNFKYLYDKFCQQFGLNGTTGRAEVNDTQIIDRKMKVFFDANIEAELNWEFEPEQRYIEVNLGQTGLAYYRVKNLADKPLVGTSTFSVSPPRAAPFFIKTECFCFQEQLVQPGEEVSMPVIFYVDPELDDEPLYKNIAELTLSYTFFKVDDPEILQQTASAAQSRDALN